MFTLDKCTIRPAEFSDLADLTRMAKTICEGTDYLPGIAAKWIAEGGLFVALYNNQVIGCVKVTMLPDNVLWFAGLSVHARYQGQGVGGLINAYAF
ncbi:MAG: GNAT family N-acetyltransferase [Candidatus Cloacimonetes bacterium]|nr:GNAT family N-acetyltransferase [Candidatus Cloacimonadota bacterium]